MNSIKGFDILLSYEGPTQLQHIPSVFLPGQGEVKLCFSLPPNIEQLHILHLITPRTLQALLD